MSSAVSANAQALIDTLPELPWASLQADDVVRLQTLAYDGEWLAVWEELSSEAATQEACMNYGRAEVLYDASEQAFNIATEGE